METHRITQSIGHGPQQQANGKHLNAGVTLVNRYLIQDVVGVGGMGAVYRARDLHFPKMVKLVAVKEMINQAADPQVRQTIVQNFEREANVLATLHHPAIPRILDYFTQAERSYLVMEYVRGKDLEKILTEAPDFLPQDQVIQWTIELCDVLDYLHNHEPEPIIFRDVKPSNVMINDRNQIVLVDFGIAKPFQTGQRGTQVGTEGYSPPEQYRGDATPLADVYALGATIHHLLTNQDPRMEAPFSFSDRPARKYNAAISVELETVLSTALQYNPEDRFKSAGAMREALLMVAQRTGVLARGSMATATIHSSGGIKPLWSFRCEDEIRGTPLYRAGAIFVGCYDNNMYRINAADGEFVWKYASEGGIVSRPAYAENNIYFGSEDQRLHSISERSGRIVWTYYTEAPIRSSPRIAESHVFIGSDDGFLHAVNTLSARPAWRIDIGAPIRSTPQITNDFVYFGSEDGDMVCVDFGGSTKWRYKAKRAVTSSPVVKDGAVYFTSVDSTLYALDAEAGWVLWRYRLGKPSISTPAVIDNLVIVGSVDGQIYGIDASNGKERWRFQTDHQVTGSAVINKDAVYCGSVDGNLYCLEYRTGRIRWKFKTEGPITGSPIIHDDILYVGSNDHMLYALLA